MFDTAKVMGFIVMFIIEMSMSTAIDTESYLYYSSSYLTQFKFVDTVFITWLSAIPSCAGLGMSILIIMYFCCKRKSPYRKNIYQSYEAI